MVIVKSEFALALNQVASERGISVDDVIVSMEAAILAAFKKEHPETLENENITVKLDMSNGETRILEDKKDITPPGFGRIAAQTARQVVIQKIREAEKDSNHSLPGSDRYSRSWTCHPSGWPECLCRHGESRGCPAS
jgi:N utilization substance protein A